MPLFLSLLLILQMNLATVKIDKRKLNHSDTIVVILQTPAINPVATADITKSIDSVTQRLSGTLVVKNADSSFLKDVLPTLFASIVAALVGAGSAYMFQNRTNQLNICYHKIDRLTSYLYKHDEYLKKCMGSEGPDASNIDNLLKSDEHEKAQFDAKFLDKHYENRKRADKFLEFENCLKDILKKSEDVSNADGRLINHKNADNALPGALAEEPGLQRGLDDAMEKMETSCSKAQRVLNDLLDSLAFKKSVLFFKKILK
ncbi:MAG: hypothetical protein HGB11_03230 [Chlorobiales bacterium]|nr:hypothetical protein [Chlorobiales bacterium]